MTTSHCYTLGTQTANLKPFKTPAISLNTVLILGPDLPLLLMPFSFLAAGHPFISENNNYYVVTMKLSQLYMNVAAQPASKVGNHSNSDPHNAYKLVYYVNKLTSN